MFTEWVPRDIYELVLVIASLPVLAFLIWLSWFFINLLFNPRWQQERRRRQILKAQQARQELLEAMREKDKSALQNGNPPGAP